MLALLYSIACRSACNARLMSVVCRLPLFLLQNQFSSALPDPSGNYTLFAPTDTAFFSLLTTYSERTMAACAC